jgi:4-amino-4-deoxy-L-arabinose transferase-like glycosyltransferase
MRSVSSDSEVRTGWVSRARAAALRSVFFDTTGMTRTERVMHWLAVASCVFFAATAFWECLGAPRAGHVSTSCAYATAGENMVRWHKFAVVVALQSRPPTPDQYYCHHPYGISIMEAFAYLVFGHGWFTPKAGAIFCSVISPPLVYAFGRRAWNVIAASVATLFFVFIPIDLAFNTFSNLEEPTIAFGLLFAWASTRLWESSERKYLALAAVGALGASNGDWIGLVFLGPVVAFGFVRAYVLPRRWYGRIDDRTFAQWFAWATAMAVGTLVLYLVLFGKADKLNDLLGSYHLRSSGSDVAIEETFSQRRKLWIGTMLTPMSLGVMALGVPLAVVRVVKKPLEIFTIAWFLAASFQYFVFKQGADIHIFWPHYYAPTSAFAAGTLTATLIAGRGWLVRALGRLKSDEIARGVALGAGILIGLFLGVPLLLLARVSLPELVLSRKTGGRFDQGGQLMTTDADLAEWGKWAVSSGPPTATTTLVLEKFEYGYASEYAGDKPLARTSKLTPSKPDDPQRIAVVDTRNQPVKELETIAHDFQVDAVGPFWRVDRAMKGPAIEVHRYDEREPNPLEWLFVSGTDLVYKIHPEVDPYKTWELEDALDLPATIPTEEPVTVDEVRIAHNLAVRQGDLVRARQLADKASRLVGHPAGLKFTDGVTLQGIDVHHGSAIVVTLFWETDETFKRVETALQLKCKVVAPPPLWPTSLDYFEKDMAPVPVIHVGSWKAGGLYTQRFIALHRIGKEECRAVFTRDLHPVTGEATPVIITFD